jgi:hypothetical protein
MNSERYGHDDLPKVGAKVGTPNGYVYTVKKVYGSHKITCVNAKQNREVDFQANDLRKVPQSCPHGNEYPDCPCSPDWARPQ